MWKSNWEACKKRFVKWWHHEGLLIGGFSKGKPEGGPHAACEDPGEASSLDVFYTDAEWRTAHYDCVLANRRYPYDMLPILSTDIGPGSLATFIGSEPVFAWDTVWYEPVPGYVEDPDHQPELQFDPQNHWWQVSENLLRRGVEKSQGNYMVGCPDLIENLDILASLRGSQTLLYDLIERPEWVERKVDEINHVFFEAYQRVYDIIKLPDGSSNFAAFMIWGPGKVAKVQCDISAMISPRMFDRFVTPALSRQCEWLDYSLFHLDGHQCIPHLDLLLAIDALDAVEWTPDPQVPPGGSPEWYPMYRRILQAGKSVQAIGVKPDEIIPMLEAVGYEGMYIVTYEQDTEELSEVVDELVRRGWYDAD